MYPAERETASEPSAGGSFPHTDGDAGPGLVTARVNLGTEHDRETGQARTLGGQFVSCGGHARLSVVRATDGNGFAHHSPGLSELRDVGLEAAVDGITAGIEKCLSAVSSRKSHLSRNDFA